ncbi:MAG: DMT family transporter [Oscillospiraceae bacterium]|nr:DMT family transporter [Oscillospiraceae bacterium]
MLDYIWVVLTAIAFGTGDIALKTAGQFFTALQLTFLRFFIGGIILLPLAIIDLKKRKYRLTGGDLAFLVLLGAVNICVSMNLFQAGVMRTNASLAAIIISTNPVATMIFAHFLVNDRFTKKKAVVLILSIIGLVIVANPMNALKSGNVGISGMLLVVLAALTFGLYTAMGKLRIDKIGGPATNSISFIAGSLINLVILLAGGTSPFAGINAQSVGSLLYCSLIVTGFGYLCYLRAIERLGASNASISFFLKPIIAVTLSAIILHETITVFSIIGTLLVLAGFAYNLHSNRSNI